MKDIIKGDLGTLNDSSSRKDDSIDQLFKKYLKIVLSFKLEFDRNYFERQVQGQKVEINLILEIIQVQLRKFKAQQMSDASHSSNIFVTDLSQELQDGKSSPQKNLMSESSIETLAESLEKFERILEILINSSPEDLFREVKSLILNEFDNTKIEIQNYLEQNNNEEICKFFTSISQTILFTLSNISFKLDYYSLALNSMVEKMNKFFIDFVDVIGVSSNNQEFIKCSDMVQKFIRIKKVFLKDFFENKTIKKESDTNIFNNVSYNRFSSFGRYFFNNIFNILNEKSEAEISHTKPTTEKAIFRIFKKNLSRDKILWKSHTRSFNEAEGEHMLDKFFKLYFTAKFANWKYSSITSGQKKIEICRVCEQSFQINDFVLHSFYCKEQKMHYANLKEIKVQVKDAITELKTYRE